MTNLNMFMTNFKHVNYLIKHLGSSLSFMYARLNERLLPNNTYFKIYDPAAQHDTDTQMNSCSLLKRTNLLK